MALGQRLFSAQMHSLVHWGKVIEGEDTLTLSSFSLTLYM